MYRKDRQVDDYTPNEMSFAKLNPIQKMRLTAV